MKRKKYIQNDLMNVILMNVMMIAHRQMHRQIRQKVVLVYTTISGLKNKTICFIFIN